MDGDDKFDPLLLWTTVDFATPVMPVTNGSASSSSSAAAASNSITNAAANIGLTSTMPPPAPPSSGLHTAHSPISAASLAALESQAAAGSLFPDSFPQFLADAQASIVRNRRHLLEVKPESMERDAVSSSAKRKGETEGTDEDIDQEEKRRRNSAASARFRLKKKMKEQKLETVAKIMADKADVLQRRVQVLEAEVKYLRDLLTMRVDREREDQVLAMANAQRDENLALAALEPLLSDTELDNVFDS